MKHMTYADKSFLLGDEAADRVMKYAALLAQNNTADTVTLHAISADGNETEVTLLLDAGAPVMAETTHSSQPEPDNSEMISYMKAQTEQFVHSTGAMPDDASSISSFDHSDGHDGHPGTN